MEDGQRTLSGLDDFQKRFQPIGKSESRLIFVSTDGVQPKGTLPFGTVHPVSDYNFRRVPLNSKPFDLEIHQLKFPTNGAERDLNVIFLGLV